MKISKVQLAAAAVVALGAVLAAPAHAGKTLDAIKARGQVACGVNTGLAGFAAADSSGKWSGLDVDVCKALAAATLGDADAVRLLYGGSVKGSNAAELLAAGDVDGALVGGASLNAAEFLAIAKAV